MRVVVLGASGLLGQSITDELLAGGHQVIGVSRSGGGSRALQAPGSRVATDVVSATDAELDRLLEGADAVAYCFGLSDREPLPVPVPATFERLLVAPTRRVAQAVHRQQVGHLVLMGSYFASLDRLNPQWGLSRHHPYIAARVAQTEQAVAACGPEVLSALELPFVFGTVPGLEPSLKQAFFDKLLRGRVAATLPGGTAGVTTRDVARAFTAIVTGAAPAGRYPLAVDNLTYRHLTEVVLAELHRRARIVTIPAPVLTAGLVTADGVNRLRGRSRGLSARWMVRDLLARRLYLDLEASCAPFGLTPRSVDDAIRETVRAAYPDLTGG